MLSAFCKNSGIPIAETQAGKGSLPWDHKQNLGAIGVTGTNAANLIAQKADLVICIGSRLSDFTTASKTLFNNKNVKFKKMSIKSKISKNSQQSENKSDGVWHLTCCAVFYCSPLSKDNYKRYLKVEQTKHL